MKLRYVYFFLTTIITYFALLVSAQASSSAYDICNSMWDDDKKMDCLDVVRDGYFQDTAIDICNSMWGDSDKVRCLQKIRGKNFESGELSVCLSQLEDSNKIECLNRNGHEALESMFEDALTDTITDVLDQIFGNSQNTSPYRDFRHHRRHRQNQYESRCRVENSTGRDLNVVISARDFLVWAQNQATNNNNCVVTNVKYLKNSHVVINKYGHIVGKALTEEDANRTKRRNRMHRCQRLICIGIDENGYDLQERR